MRRKARRYQYGAYIKGTGTRLKGMVSVAEIPLYLTGGMGQHMTMVKLFIEPQPKLCTEFFVWASNGAEKSCQRRRRKRGLRKGKRRSRECHSRRSASRPAPAPKPPNLRKVLHRRRPERWLMKTAFQFSTKDCKQFKKVLKLSCLCVIPFGERKCKNCFLKDQSYKHCRVKWLRLHLRARQLGFPDAMAFDSSFDRYFEREILPGNVVYERAILRGSEPFRWIDPLTEFEHLRIMENHPRQNTTYHGCKIEPVNRERCPFCRKSWVTPQKPVCRRRACGRACKTALGWDNLDSPK